MAAILFLILSFSFVQSISDTAEISKPIPELGPFIEGIRAKLHSDEALLSNYTYTENTEIRELDGEGRPKKALRSRIYEVYPSADSEEPYKKLVSKDGKPLSPEESAKKDRDEVKRQEKAIRNLKKEDADDARRREEKKAEARRKEQAAIDDLFKLYNIAILGREKIDGRAAIALQFEPRPDYKPATSEGKILAKVHGRAWFCEEDHELMKIDVEFFRDHSLALGFLAKVKRGTQMTFERRRVNDEIWLPASVRMRVKAKAMVFVGFNLVVETKYSDYRKFSVRTSVKYTD